MWIVSGMGAVIFAVLNLIFSMQDKTEKVKWFRFTSMALTALTLCAVYSDSAGRVSAEDWGALMDIMPTMSTVLWICTGSSIIMNSVSLFKEKKYHVSTHIHRKERNMERTIKVKGTGKISVKPDTIKILITASKVCRKYDQTVSRSAEDTGIIREAIERAGLEPKQLKTVKFDIDSEYVGYRDKNDDYQRRFEGYRYTHNMYIQFPNDNAQLGKILYELACCDVNVEFSIRHTVRDIDEAKNKLLEKAVDDSISKANILAAAAGVSLGEIKSIDYSWAELEIYSEPMVGFMMAETSSLTSSDSFDIDIEADDIDVRDTVTIEWEIR